MRGLIGLCLVLMAAPAGAGEYRGSVEVSAPLETPDRVKDDSPTLTLRAQAPRVWGRLGAGIEVRQQLRGGAPYSDENRLVATLEVPRRDATWFVFWERRYSTGEERVVGGVRLPFRGRW